MKRTCAFVGLTLVSLASASADVLTARYDVPWDPPANTFFIINAPVNPPVPNPAVQNVPAVVINGLRIDSPGVGIDNTVAVNHPAFCVELGVDIPLSAGNLFNAPAVTFNVSPLAGSTTNLGGLTGPVFFDAVRTSRMERLWADHYNGLIQTNVAYSAAFQYAVWKIAFETSPGALDLINPGQRMTATVVDAIALQAQAMLNTVDLVGAHAQLALLSNDQYQDLITIVPTPGAMSLLVGAGLLASRRRR